MKDALNQTLSGASTHSLIAYQAAQEEFQCFLGDPVASLDAAIAAQPGMPMAHLFKAWLHLLGTEPAGLAVARACCDAAAALGMNDREQRHLHAARLLADGRWHDAARTLEDLSLQYPHDLLALQVGHQLDFFTGDARMLRDRIARALPAWQPGMPGLHAVLSMHAFGLEETGDYTQAEKQGHAALALQPRDGWAWHAVAHVHEMRNDPRAGIAWLAPNAATWAEGSFFAGHNWWHLALFNLELGRTGEVLRLYDETIGGPGSSVVLDLVDQSALLWRLHLRGVNVAGRFAALAARWAATAHPGQYAFNDMHAMMAYAATGDAGAAQAVLEAQHQALQADADNARFTHDVGYAATRALQAFAEGDYVLCADLLRGVRSRSHRFGGSHAQRDVIDLTLMEAARRAGDEALLAGLCSERERVRPLFVRPGVGQMALAA